MNSLTPKSEIVLQELSQLEAMDRWPEAETFLRQAVTDDNPDNYLRNVQAYIFGGMHSLWRLVDCEDETIAYGVTNIYTPDGLCSVAQLYLTTSKGLEQLLEQMDQFTAWTIKKNVDYVEIIGRKGWERILRPHGFTHNHTSLIKRVIQELH